MKMAKHIKPKETFSPFGNGYLNFPNGSLVEVGLVLSVEVTHRIGFVAKDQLEVQNGNIEFN